MKNFLLFILALTLLAGCTASKNTATAVGEGTKEAAEQVNDKATDASITAAVKMKFADDPVVSASAIDVDTKDGIVTLNGTVKSAAEQQKAVEIAQGVDGVKQVKSNLKIQ